MPLHVKVPNVVTPGAIIKRLATKDISPGRRAAAELNPYWICYNICYGLIIIGSCIYCVASYGYPVGLGSGWLPSAIHGAFVNTHLVILG
jgi:hypothetical protein